MKGNKRWKAFSAGLLLVFVLANFTSYGVHVSAAPSPKVVKVVNSGECGSSTCSASKIPHVASGDVLVLAWACGANTACTSYAISDTLGTTFPAPVVQEVGVAGSAKIYAVTVSSSGSEVVTFTAASSFDRGFLTVYVLRGFSASTSNTGVNSCSSSCSSTVQLSSGLTFSTTSPFFAVAAQSSNLPDCSGSAVSFTTGFPSKVGGLTLDFVLPVYTLY